MDSINDEQTPCFKRGMTKDFAYIRNKAVSQVHDTSVTEIEFLTTPRIENLASNISEISLTMVSEKFENKIIT